jgi:hypothetical protein
MPQAFNPGSGQDWAPVNTGSGAMGGKKGVPKSARQVDQLKASGLLSTEMRYGAGGNKSAHTATAMSANKLDQADDVGSFAKVGKDLSKAIMQVSIFVAAKNAVCVILRPSRLTCNYNSYS